MYTPSQWYECIRTARQTKRPFKVIEVEQNDIKNWKDIVEGQNWPENNVKGEKVPWTQMKEIYCDPNHPGVLKYKTCYDQDYEEINVLQNSSIETVENYHLVNAYNGPLHISAAKIKDLLHLCENFSIPAEHHEIYNNLAAKNPSEKKPTPREHIVTEREEQSEEKKNKTRQKIVTATNHQEFRRNGSIEVEATHSNSVFQQPTNRLKRRGTRNDSHLVSEITDALEFPPLEDEESPAGKRRKSDHLPKNLMILC